MLSYSSCGARLWRGPHVQAVISTAPGSLQRLGAHKLLPLPSPSLSRWSQCGWSSCCYQICYYDSIKARVCLGIITCLLASAPLDYKLHEGGASALVQPGRAAPGPGAGTGTGDIRCREEGGTCIMSFSQRGCQVRSLFLFCTCRIQAQRCEVTCPGSLSLQVTGTRTCLCLDPKFFAVAICRLHSCPSRHRDQKALFLLGSMSRPLGSMLVS